MLRNGQSACLGESARCAKWAQVEFKLNEKTKMKEANECEPAVIRELNSSHRVGLAQVFSSYANFKGVKVPALK